MYNYSCWVRLLSTVDMQRFQMVQSLLPMCKAHLHTEIPVKKQ
jgi:hypothetical protein